MIDPDEESSSALGAVVEQDRGALPFALIHGEPLVAAAAWALTESGVVIVDLTTEWSTIVETGEPMVLHDALCPMTPPAFLAECVRRCQDSGAVVVGVRPVTDTVKQVVDGYAGETLDRDALLTVTSPIVLPPDVVAALDAMPSDFIELATWLAARYPVVTAVAPAEGRRVSEPGDIRLLEALTRPVGSAPRP